MQGRVARALEEVAGRASPGEGRRRRGFLGRSASRRDQGRLWNRRLFAVRRATRQSEGRRGGTLGLLGQGKRTSAPGPGPTPEALWHSSEGSAGRRSEFQGIPPIRLRRSVETLLGPGNPSFIGDKGD